MQIAILVLLGLIALVVWIFSEVQNSFETSRKNKEKLEKVNQKWGARSKEGTLESRNEDIIQAHLERLKPGYQRSHYIEDSIRNCIQEITEAEKDLSMSPNHEYLYRWEKRANAEYLQLKDLLYKRFRNKHHELDEKEATKARKKVDARFVELKEKYADLISQFYTVAERKVSLVDDYGDENWGALPKEILALIKKIAGKEGSDASEFDLEDWKKYAFTVSDQYKPYMKLADHLEKTFREYHESRKALPSSSIDYSKMEGKEFEVFLMKLLKESGFEKVVGTPATGDQGADLIAVKDGKTIIIQAKRYGSTVGNKAVQEVIAAVNFYKGDEGWVITNSTFTKSAKELAQKAGVRLIDSIDLARFSEIFGGASSDRP